MNMLPRLHFSIRVLILSAFCADLSHSDCSAETATEYHPINETLYDRNYSRIDSGKHPLGFYAAIWRYNQGVANPCFKILAAGARTSRLEIKVQTEPPARLCVKDQKAATQCFQSEFSDCRETPGDATIVEFLCDSQCEEGDVSFWYRLVLSPPGAVDWCLYRDNLFPADLATVPPGMTLPPITTPAPKDGTGTGSPAASSSLPVLATALMIVTTSIF